MSIKCVINNVEIDSPEIWNHLSKDNGDIFQSVNIINSIKHKIYI